MTDIVERLLELSMYDHDGLSICDEALNEIESLRQQLAESQAREKVLREALDLSWSEEYVNGISARFKAREALTLPSDSTALDTMLNQAKREALLEASDILTKLWGQSVTDIVGDLRRMAEELKLT